MNNRVMSRPGSRFWRRGFVGTVGIVCAIAVGTPDASAQNVGDDNSDIDAVLHAVKQAQEFADLCQGDECVEFDCDAAKQVLQEVRDTRQYFILLPPVLREANDAQLDLLRRQAEQSLLNERTISEMIDLNEYQEGMNQAGRDAINIMGLASSVVSHGTNPGGGSTAKQVTSALYDFYEAAKSLEGLLVSLDEKFDTQTINSTPVADFTPEFFGQSKEAINESVSTLNNFKAIIESGALAADNVNPKVNRAVAIAAVGQIAIRFSVLWNEELIAERSEKIDELRNDLVYSDEAQGNAFEALRRIQTRRHKAIDAIPKIDALIVSRSDETGRYMKCLRQFCDGVNPTYTSTVSIPEDLDQPDYGGTEGWGEKLVFLDARIAEMPAKLAVPPIAKSPAPALSLWVTEYVTGEEFEIGFQASACFAPDAWVGFVPADTPHGEESVNDPLASGHKYLRRQAKGTLELTAPMEPGEYDIRMHDTDKGGREVASLPVTIKLLDANGVWGMLSPGVRITHDRTTIRAVYAASDACWKEGELAFEGTLTVRKFHATLPAHRCHSCVVELEGTFEPDGNSLNARWYYPNGCGDSHPEAYHGGGWGAFRTSR